MAEDWINCEDLPKRYRIDDHYNEDEDPVMRTWYVVRKTPQGAWIAPRYAVTGLDASTGKQVQWHTLKRDQLRIEGARYVLDGDGKRFAHETIEQARYSYRRRKQMQIRFAQRSIRRARHGLQWLETGNVPQSDFVHLVMEDNV